MGKKFKIEPRPVPHRGLKRADFKDAYGVPCSIQESSIADAPHIWLGQNVNEPPHPVTGNTAAPRMHLNVDMAKELIRLLSKFVETGGL